MASRTRSVWGEHLVVPETNYLEAPTFQERGALGIVGDQPGMLRAINLDDQHGIETEEIDDVRPNGFLPPKLPAEDLASAQCCQSSDSASVGWLRI
jgi:hypothetical protein